MTTTNMSAAITLNDPAIVRRLRLAVSGVNAFFRYNQSLGPALSSILKIMPGMDSLFHCLSYRCHDKETGQVLEGTHERPYDCRLAELLRHTLQSERLPLEESNMTGLKKWSGVCLALVLVGSLMTGMALAQDAKGKDSKAQDEKVFEGALMSIDQNSRVLTLKAGDKEMQFSYNEQTELVAPDNDGKPTAVAQGTKMRVHYTEREKTNIATKIEIITTTAAR